MADDLSRVSGRTRSLDGYRNMRLNVNSMSYEELLALGQRIVRAYTGIPEEKISTSLTGKEFSDHDQERSCVCVICLEVYKIKDEIVAIKKCGHEYHAFCINKWLLMKNSCPICRRAALDPPKND